MFVLAEMRNVVRVSPDLFGQKLNDAIAEQLNKKLANKVVLNVGLCICLYDITAILDSFIFPGDGASHTKVTFRFIVFRPFIEEVVLGKIRSCSPEGVHVTLGFFDDILIPPNALPHPSRFSEAEQAWAWAYETEDGQKYDLFLDSGETVRFKVIEEKFSETCPQGAPQAVVEAENKAPYSLLGSINESGLGLLTWWESSDS